MRSVRRNPEPGERPSAEDALPVPLVAGDEQPAALRPLLRALAADPRPHELSGFEEPLASFRAAFASTRSAAARTTWRPSMLSTLLSAKLGATVAGVAVALGGTAVAAYTGVLPTGVQNAAHSTVAAPAATAKPTGTAKPSTTHEPVGPDATGPAAFGLCNAWSHHQGKTKGPGDDPGEKAGEKPGDSVAFRNLAKAVGGEGKIATYCATIPHPGNGKGNSKDKDKGKKATHPTGKATSSPTSTAK
jgi:hypothetical protein